MAFKDGRFNGKPVRYREEEIASLHVVDGYSGEAVVVATMMGSGDRIFVGDVFNRREDAEAYIRAASVK